MNPGQDTDSLTYTVVVLSYSIGIGIIACLIDDLSLVFGIFAGFNEALLVTILPSFIFVKAIKHIKQKMYLQRLGAFLFSLLGLMYFFLCNYWNMVKIKRYI